MKGVAKLNFRGAKWVAELNLKGVKEVAKLDLRISIPCLPCPNLGRPVAEDGQPHRGGAAHAGAGGRSRPAGVGGWAGRGGGVGWVGG